MSGWLLFWIVVLILGLLVFFGLAIAITIGGFHDILAMCRRIEQQHEGEESEK